MAINTIRKIFGWKKEEEKPLEFPVVELNNSAQTEAVETEPANVAEGGPTNVINLADHSPKDPMLSEDKDSEYKGGSQHKGLLDDDELKSLLAPSAFYGLGKHNGAKYKSEAARDLGCHDIIEQLRNILERMIARRVSKLNQLQLAILEVEGSSTVLANKLRYACSSLEGDIASLKIQLDLCSQGKGWALAPLNGYRLGFEHGLQSAYQYDLLSV